MVISYRINNGTSKFDNLGVANWDLEDERDLVACCQLESGILVSGF